MNNLKEVLAFVAAIAFAVLIGTAAAIFITDRYPNEKGEEVLGGDLALGVCEVRESVVAIGNSTSTQILAKSPYRQWAIIQQPVNATNTISFSLTGPAVSGEGYQLAATSSEGIPEFRFGYATELRTEGAVAAITSAGSSTVKVIDCR